MKGRRISIFPLPGALLFPGDSLPLHIFEPRYRALVSDALARDQLIGMIQPRDESSRPELYPVGCLGRIVEFEALEDGRYNILLSGLARFRVIRELEVSTPFRQIEATVEDEAAGDDAALAPARRAALEMEARRFADRLGYVVDWSAVSALDDAALVNGIARIAPFDVAAKQSLLETPGLDERADLTIDLMRFFGRVDDAGPATMQ